MNKHALRGCYLSALASLRPSALDRAYYDKQVERHRGHPKAHVVALIALARQRLKLFYKLLTTEAAYDKEILIASHLARRQRAKARFPQAAPPSPPPAPTSPPAEGMENLPEPPVSHTLSYDAGYGG
ncbi:MAG: hypothetical protein AAGC60_29395 [Acidobacteriota bacterium]